MDLIKIGKFIAKCRKDKNLTQLQLAEKLSVTDRAVSKWENGRSVPDSSIMLNLCNALGITVNELLAGERLEKEKINKANEENLLSIIKEKEESDKRLLLSEVVFGTFGIATILTLILLGALLEIEMWIRLVLIFEAVVLIVPFALFLLWIEQKTGYYICPHCGYRYVPTYKSVLMAPHYFTTRLMKCPKCGQKGWHKKTINKSGNESERE